MKAIIEKQLVQWKEELARHVETRNKAQRVLEEETKTILMIEGGIQGEGDVVEEDRTRIPANKYQWS